MPILYVNPSKLGRRGLKVKGRARVRRRNPTVRGVGVASAAPRAKTGLRTRARRFGSAMRRGAGNVRAVAGGLYAGARGSGGAPARARSATRARPVRRKRRPGRRVARRVGRRKRRNPGTRVGMGMGAATRPRRARAVRRRSRFGYSQTVKGAPKRKRRRSMPAGLKAYWAKRRGRKSPKKKATRRRRRRSGGSQMAKRKKRRKGGKRKKSVKRRRGRRTAARLGWRRRRAKRGKKKNPAKRRKRRASGRRKSRRKKKRGRATAARLGHRRRRRKGVKGAKRKGARRRKRRGVPTHLRETILMKNPRRRRRKSSRRRRGGGRRRRRSSRRRGRRGRYRRNPGFGGGLLKSLIGMAKQALPVMAGLIGTRIFVSRIGPMIPGASSLGVAAHPVLTAAAGLGLGYLAGKVKPLQKYRTQLMIGAGISLLESLVSSFVPGAKGLLGMGDIYDNAMGEYVSVGEYVGVGADPLDDDIAMADYIQVGSDGVEEELGMGVSEELGVDEELGNDLLGGVSQSSLMKTVPRRSFLEPIPARSFTKPVRMGGPGYDNSASLYQGVFRNGLFS